MHAQMKHTNRLLINGRALETATKRKKQMLGLIGFYTLCQG